MQIYDWIFIVSMILVIILSSTYSARYLLKYQDLHALRNFLIIFYFNLWTISRMLISLQFLMDLFSPEVLFITLRVGNMALMASLLTISYLLTNPFFDELVRTLAIMAFALYSSVATFAMVDFIEPIFFLYVIEDNNFINIVHPLVIIFIVSAFILLTISYLLAINNLKKFPTSLSQTTNVNHLITIPLVAIVTILFLIIVSNFDFSYSNKIFTIFNNILFFYVIFRLFRQPYLQFNFGLSAEFLVEKNYVGYMLGAITDVGPDVILTSDIFNKIVGLDEVGVMTLNIGGTTALGMNESFDNKIGIIPVPNNPDLSAIMFTFRVFIEGLEDPELKMTSPAVIAIIIPSVLIVNLKNISSAQDKLGDIISEYPNLRQLQEDKELKIIVSRLLDELAY